MEDTVKLLWTGGWDSTFRLLQLTLVEKRSVQPIYVIDRSRRSRWREMEAMDEILDLVTARKSSSVTIYPRKVFVRFDYPDIQDLKDRYESLASRMRVGSQYYWLAVVAESEGLQDAELCMPKHELPSGVQEAVFDGIEEGNPVIKKSWEACLFSYWSFPCLSITKEEMREYALEHEFMDILIKRWFCFNPIGGKACRECRPCHIAIEDRVVDGVDFVPYSYIKFKKIRQKARRGLKRFAKPILWFRDQ